MGNVDGHTPSQPSRWPEKSLDPPPRGLGAEHQPAMNVAHFKCNRTGHLQWQDSPIVEWIVVESSEHSIKISDYLAFLPQCCRWKEVFCDTYQPS